MGCVYEKVLLDVWAQKILVFSESALFHGSLTVESSISSGLILSI